MKNWIDSFIRNKAYIHGIVVLGFALVSLLFYYPVLSGKTLLQSDILQYEGMSRQLKEHRAKTAEETYWIDNAYGGMPTYQLVHSIERFFILFTVFLEFYPPAHILFCIYLERICSL